MVYTSINNDKIKNIKKLHNKKYRDQLGLFLIEGEHLLKEATTLEYIIVLEGHDIDTLVDKIIVSKSVMKYLSNLDCPPKVMGVCRKLSNKMMGNKILVLDNIQDPGNLGTIIRSAVAFNFDTLIIGNNGVDLYNSKVVRASQGMLFHLNIIICDLEDKLNELKTNNYHIVGTDVVKGKRIKEVAKFEKICIIMGNEGQGVSSNIKNMCDDFIYIDMNNLCESLNVGVAASIIMYEMR